MNLERMMLQVLDNPTQQRIIIYTGIPSLMGSESADIESLANGEILDDIYYMIDRSADCGDTAADEWYVSIFGGGGMMIPTNVLLLEFIEQINNNCSHPRIAIESY